MKSINNFEINCMVSQLKESWNEGFEPFRKMLDFLFNQVKGLPIAMAELTHAIEEAKEFSFDEDVEELCDRYLEKLDIYAENGFSQVEMEEYNNNKA